MTKKRDLPPGVVSSVDDLAAAMGYHRRTVQAWKSLEGFPIRSDGNYEILRVHEWREKRYFSEKLNYDDYQDISNRSHELVQSLFDIQAGLIQSLPESERDAFVVRLRDGIGDAILDAFKDGLEASYYIESYVSRYDEEEADRLWNALM